MTAKDLKQEKQPREGGWQPKMQQSYDHYQPSSPDLVARRTLRAILQRRRLE
jgi:hypothetical protein